MRRMTQGFLTLAFIARTIRRVQHLLETDLGVDGVDVAKRALLDRMAIETMRAYDRNDALRGASAEKRRVA